MTFNKISIRFHSIKFHWGGAAGRTDTQHSVWQLDNGRRVLDIIRITIKDMDNGAEYVLKVARLITY